MDSDSLLLIDLFGHYFQLISRPFDKPHAAAKIKFFDSVEGAESFLRSIVNVSENSWQALAAQHHSFGVSRAEVSAYTLVAQHLAAGRIKVYTLPSIESRLAHDGKGTGYAFFKGSEPLPNLPYPIRKVEDDFGAQALLDNLQADKGDWVYMMDQNGLVDQDLSQKSVDGVKQLIAPHLLDGTLSAYEIPYSPPKATPRPNIVEEVAQRAATLGPEPEPDNWIDLEYKYADGSGVGGAAYTVSEVGGGVVASGTLSPEGKAYVVLPQHITEVEVKYHDDPQDIATLKPSEPKQAEDPPGWFDRMSDRVSAAFWRDWEQTKKEAEWVWGMVQGDFNEDPSVSQIITNAVITMIPVVDQVGDVRDVLANLKLLVWDKKYDEFGPWLGLFFTLIGLIPTLGSALKAVLRIVWKGSKLADLLKVFNYFMKGNGVKWLKELQGGKLDDYAKQAAKIGEDVFDAVIKKLEELKTKLPKGLKELHQQIKETLDVLKEVKGMIDDMFKEISKQLKEKIGKLVDEGSEEAGEKAAAKGNYTKGQEAEAPASKKSDGEPPKEKTAKEKLAERRRQETRRRHREKMDEADKKGRYDALNNDEKKWIEEDPAGKRKELAFDAETGKYKVDEAKAAMLAEQQGMLKPPVDRPDPNIKGVDFVDGDGVDFDVKKPFDPRSSTIDSDVVNKTVIDSAKKGENIILDVDGLSAQEIEKLSKIIDGASLPSGSGQIVFPR